MWLHCDYLDHIWRWSDTILTTLSKSVNANMFCYPHMTQVIYNKIIQTHPLMIWLQDRIEIRWWIKPKPHRYRYAKWNKRSVATSVSSRLKCEQQRANDQVTWLYNQYPINYSTGLHLDSLVSIPKSAPSLSKHEEALKHCFSLLFPNSILHCGNVSKRNSAQQKWLNYPSMFFKFVKWWNMFS